MIGCRALNNVTEGIRGTQKYGLHFEDHKQSKNFIMGNVFTDNQLSGINDHVSNNYVYGLVNGQSQFNGFRLEDPVPNERYGKMLYEAFDNTPELHLKRNDQGRITGEMELRCQNNAVFIASNNQNPVLVRCNGNVGCSIREDDAFRLHKPVKDVLTEKIQKYIEIEDASGHSIKLAVVE